LPKKDVFSKQETPEDEDEDAKIRNEITHLENENPTDSIFAQTGPNPRENPSHEYNLRSLYRNNNSSESRNTH